MSKRSLFLLLASASGFIGIGLLLGYALSDQATNTPLWIGVILTLLGAILLGMFISARGSTAPTSPQDVRPSQPPVDPEV